MEAQLSMIRTSLHPTALWLFCMALVMSLKHEVSPAQPQLAVTTCACDWDFVEQTEVLHAVSKRSIMMNVEFQRVATSCIGDSAGTSFIHTLLY